MNVYDFDKTIYDGDCTVDFVFYCFKKFPALIFKIPYQLFNGILFISKLRKKDEFKKHLYSFLKEIPAIDEVIDTYTTLHLKNIKSWYLNQQRDSDLIISASPDFLIESFCKKINITYWMASPVDKYSGEFLGENCFGEEKVRRFDEIYSREDIEDFYSDSYSDSPLANLSKRAFLVKGNQLLPWGK